MIRCVALVGLLIAGLTTEAGSLEERVHAYVEQSRQTQGIAVALLTPGEVTRAVSGWAGPDRAVNKETLFEIGSVTKVFTGLLLAQLNEDGVVSLNSTVGELMPGPWELDPEVASIRLRELATHTSGLPRLPVNAGMLWRQLSSPADPYAGLNRDDVFSDVATLEASDLASRGEFAYAKLGPALLGRLLGTVTDESYETMIKTRVLAPLGLEDTAFTDTVLDDPRLAKPHRENLRPARNWRLDGYNPAGGLSSNLEDMIAFLQKAMTARAGTSLAKSMTEHWTRENGERGAGLGWVINERDDDRMVWHNGRTGGITHSLAFYLTGTGGWSCSAIQAIPVMVLRSAFCGVMNRHRHPSGTGFFWD